MRANHPVCASWRTKGSALRLPGARGTIRTSSVLRPDGALDPLSHALSVAATPQPHAAAAELGGESQRPS